MRKFDLTVGNPPYNGGMDIDIHKAFSGISQRIVFVHPSTFLISHKGGSFEKQMKRAQEQQATRKYIDALRAASAASSAAISASFWAL